jgi:serine/threonine-protein kinase
MDDFVERRIGRTLGGRWVLDGVLGVGGMAAVYAARDGSGAEAALKVLHPEIARRPDLRDRFLREAFIANRVGHPGAVSVFEHGETDDGSAYLAMERLHGESLAERIGRSELPLPELLDILDQVLDVLAAAHDASIVHRDLKPDNLFLTTHGTTRVLDFGVARVLEEAPDDVRTRTGMTFGTMPYMAPEQALGRRAEIDGRADIFALGATAFRIIAKRRVHEADSQAAMLVAMATKPAPPLQSVAPEVPDAVAAVVDLALAFSREARYPDARTMQADVRAVREGRAPSYATRRLQARDQATVVTVAAANAAPAALATFASPSAGPATSASSSAVPVTVAFVPDGAAKAEAKGKRRALVYGVPIGLLLFGALAGWQLWPESAAPGRTRAPQRRTPADAGAVHAVPTTESDHVAKAPSPQQRKTTMPHRTQAAESSPGREEAEGAAPPLVRADAELHEAQAKIERAPRGKGKKDPDERGGRGKR